MMRATRFEYDGRFEEKGGQQFLSGRGHYGDGYSRIHRIEGHGSASNPPKGAKGLLIAPNGHPDEAYLFGVEHPDLRPKDLPSGGKAIYDASGNIIKLIGSEGVIDLQSNTLTLTAGDWTINATPTFNGNVTINGNLQVNGNINCSGSVTDSDGNNGA
jgi:phage gp45-like